MKLCCRYLLGNCTAWAFYGIRTGPANFALAGQGMPGHASSRQRFWGVNKLWARLYIKERYVFECNAGGTKNKRPIGVDSITDGFRS